MGAYGLKGDVTLERGSNGWAFDFQNRKLIYDPSFFAERGYNMQETLFATTHELMAHCGELIRDPELILKEAKRYSRKEQLHLLYNIFEDVLGNRRIVGELPFLEETRTKLYEEKLFPQTDYRETLLMSNSLMGLSAKRWYPENRLSLVRKHAKHFRNFARSAKTRSIFLILSPLQTSSRKIVFRLCGTSLSRSTSSSIKRPRGREKERRKERLG